MPGEEMDNHCIRIQQLQPEHLGFKALQNEAPWSWMVKEHAESNSTEAAKEMPHIDWVIPVSLELQPF